MKTFPLLATSCLALSVGLSAAIAATTTSPAAASSNATVNGPANKDYARLSIDGAHAFQDIGLARLAIFEGKPAMAVKLVSDAQQSIGRAKRDDTVFMKAEGELKTTPSDTGAAAATTPTGTSKPVGRPGEDTDH